MGRGDIYNGLNYVKNKQRFWDKVRDFDVKREREREKVGLRIKRKGCFRRFCCNEKAPGVIHRVEMKTR